MEQLLYYRQRLLERFEAVAVELEEEVKNISPQGWHSPLGQACWTPHQVLAHVRDAKAHEFLTCIESILDQDIPSIDCFDREAWIAANYRPGEPVESIWSELKSLHAKEYELKFLTSERTPKRCSYIYLLPSATATSPCYGWG